MEGREMKYNTIINSLNFNHFCKEKKLKVGAESIIYLEHLIKDLINVCMGLPVLIKNGSKIEKIKQRTALNPITLEKGLLFLTIQRLQGGVSN